ncbi:DoxX family membrane protein [Streptomyces sp. AJS327]|uniref:DoxX family protein n=1 Tax=Streptomyces sp. AJS327 TaxID=2545265 RepID=UPI0015DEC3BC|nr:DoxX family protein [Streptomyces sp. AJS327]MBA0053123.1 DoxX family membrane protein [Streptomyces sp. AJS327]
MSVDTRTPRKPSPSGSAQDTPRSSAWSPQGSTRGFLDDEPVLSTVKVPCDPAQVVVAHASFRVRLSTPAPVSPALQDTAPIPTVRPTAGRRRAPVVWSGRSEPGDAGAGELLRAVRAGAVRTTAPEEVEPAAAATRVLPRVEVAEPPVTTVGPPRGPRPPETTGPLPVTRAPEPLVERTFPRPPVPGAPDPDGGHDPAAADGPDGEAETGATPVAGAGAPRRGEAVRHAYYPMRRMNLGVVLLPLRVFLGLISIYAGMGKLCDPVYFDGGERGSMVTWLRSLEPWAVASPLRDFALAHPVGSGLTVAFLQVVVGVLTVCGLWQRLAASLGALLSAALLMTVSWSTVPAYDAPDIIYLAAWSPLIIAGAPVYSVDARLAGEAWRTLGPRAEIWELRRRVLRRGAAIATVLLGLSLLTGSLLGGAVRSAQVTTVPERQDPPTNRQPGTPLPERSREGTNPGQSSRGPSGSPASPGSESSGSPSSAPTTQGPGQQESGGGGPSQRATQPPAQTAPPQQAPPPRDSPTATGGSSSPGGTASGSPGGDSGGQGSGGNQPENGDGTGGSGGQGGEEPGGGLGGLLG